MFRSPASRRIRRLLLVACACAPALCVRAQTAVPDLGRERTSVDASDAARKASDYDTARAKAADAVTSLLARPAAEQDAAWLEVLFSAGQAAWDAQDASTAQRAWKRVYDERLASLPEDDRELQRARGSLAVATNALGDVPTARTLFEKLLEVASRTRPEDDPDVQVARANLAATTKSMGDLAGARALEEKVLEVWSRTLPDDHPELQAARGNLAVTLYAQGDLRGARALLEQVLEVSARTLPEDHPDLQVARSNLAVVIDALGDLRGARALGEQVLEVRTRTLPDDHPDLQRARANLAATLFKLGDVPGARALFEKVLEVLSRTLPDDHPDLQTTRGNVAAAMESGGDLAGARALLEKVLEVDSRTLPDDHPDLQRARGNLAATIKALGDLPAARALEEKVLEIDSRTLPDDHPDLQRARSNLAGTLVALGDLRGARALDEKVLEVRSRALPDDHPDLQSARGSLAVTLSLLGDHAGARALQEKVLEIDSRTLPDDHRDLQVARGNLAASLQAQGEFVAARTLEEKVLEVLSRTRPDEHPDLQGARGNLAVTIGRQLARTGRSDADRARCSELIGALCRAQVRAARTAILESPAREAEERCSSLARYLDVSLSFAQGYGVLEPLAEVVRDSFVFAETTRGAALTSARLARGAARSPKYAELRVALREASDALADLAQKGTTGEAFDRARARRESAEREIVALAREIPGGQAGGVVLEVDSLAARLADREAAVGFRRYTRMRADAVDGKDPTAVESLCAFVVRSSRTGPGDVLTLVDLGPIAPIESAAHAWRQAIGVGPERGLSSSPPTNDGAELRRLVFDPLLPALGNANRIIVALDDVLHLVPLDALPAAATESAEGTSKPLVGDRWRIETRSTLSELLMEPPSTGGTALVALGGVSFNVTPVAFSADEPPSAVEAQPTVAAARLRGTAWERGFAPLTHSGDEARGIGALYREIYEDERPAVVLEKRKASRAALEELAPKARFLHIATHGWFAPESIRSWSDPEPIDKQSGLGARLSGVEQVRGMSPMLLCGLALAGANLPEDAAGRAPGLVTAEELSALDLAGCELVVLSACDTNVGERRAGQGVASLQKALQMAGARSVITSLWKVPDEATKDLMLDFYRRLWVEKKPKGQALWEAKKRLRETVDERGQPRYSTRDWAAWVLTGEPN